MQQIGITHLFNNPFGQFATILFNAKDYIVGDVTINPTNAITSPFFLIELQSQQSNKFIRFNPAYASSFYIDRAVYLLYKVSINQSSNPVSGFNIGTDDYPLGLYNLKVYQMESSGDLDPSNAQATLYVSLMNCWTGENTLGDDAFPSVKYKEYNNNDSDTNSVYITNTI